MANGYVGVNNVARKIIKGYVGKPSYCTPIEYIESDGSQYIDTGFKTTPTTRVVMRYRVMSYTAQDRIFGSYSNNGLYYCLYVNGNYQYSFAYQDDSGNWVSTGQSINTSGITEVDFDGHAKRLTFGGAVSYNTSLAGYTATKGSDTNLFLFANSETDGAAGQKSKIRLYSCQIYDKRTLIRDYIPVITNSNIACLYDNVTEKLYLNEGNGSFGYGSATGNPIDLGMKAHRIIRGYVGVNGVARLCFGGDKELQYIQTTGTQFINTGIAAKSTTCIETKFQITTSSTSMSYLCGCYQNGSGGNRMYVGGTGSGYIQFATTYDAWDSLYSWTQSEVTLIYNNANRQIVWNGTPKSGKTAISLGDANTQTIGLFSINPPESARWKCKMFYFKISNRSTGEVLLHLIPVQRQDGVVCFYDKISETYFENQGTGNFIAGPGA